MGYIYMLTSPSGKSYIGQTIQSIEIRFKAHQKESSNCVLIYNAIQKYGWENFEQDFYDCPDEDLNNHEKLMIEVLGTLSPGGYNLKEGGANGKLSEETKLKIGEANSGRIPSEETKQKYREARLGTTPSEETRQKIRSSNLGKTRTNQHKQRYRESKQGDKNPMYGKTGEKNYKSKKVYQYDMNGILLGTFESTREASRILETLDKGVSIGRCACGYQKTAYGHRWSYTPQV